MRQSFQGTTLCVFRATGKRGCADVSRGTVVADRILEKPRYDNTVRYPRTGVHPGGRLSVGEGRTGRLWRCAIPLASFSFSGRKGRRPSLSSTVYMYCKLQEKLDRAPVHSHRSDVGRRASGIGHRVFPIANTKRYGMSFLSSVCSLGHAALLDPSTPSTSSRVFNNANFATGVQDLCLKVRYGTVKPCRRTTSRGILLYWMERTPRSVRKYGSSTQERRGEEGACTTRSRLTET